MKRLVMLLALIVMAAGARADVRLPTVLGDPRQMQQLLQNLIGNGIKFARPGVAPVVRVSSRTPKWASSSLMARVTTGGETLSLRAAPANPPVSTTVTKMLINCRRSTLFLRT